MCEECDGRGGRVKPEDLCESCKGLGMIEEKKVLDVQIPVGVADDHRVVFERYADEHPSPGVIPGDIVIVFRLRTSFGPFQRVDGSEKDLLMEHRISLMEALTGVTIDLVHIGGEKLIIKSEKNDVIKPDEVMCVVGQGLPHQLPTGDRSGVPFRRRGDLYIRFVVVFPDKLTDEAASALKRILPVPSSSSAAAATTTTDITNNDRKVVYMTKLGRTRERQRAAV